MKFFFHIILISSCLWANSGYPYGVQDIPEPSHRLSCPYSTHHNQQPKNACPSTAFSTLETHLESVGTSDLLTSLPKYLCSKMVGILYAYGYDLYSRLLSVSVHFRYRISGSANHGNATEHLREVLNNDILSPILYGNSNYLSSGNYFGRLAHNKSIMFIETKVTAMKLQGFNL